MRNCARKFIVPTDLDRCRIIYGRCRRGVFPILIIWLSVGTPWSALYPDSFHSGLASSKGCALIESPPVTQGIVYSKPSGDVNSEIVSYQFTPEREFRSICTLAYKSSQVVGLSVPMLIYYGSCGVEISSPSLPPYPLFQRNGTEVTNCDHSLTNRSEKSLSSGLHQRGKTYRCLFGGA